MDNEPLNEKEESLLRLGLSSLEAPELPAGFHGRLLERLRQEGLDTAESSPTALKVAVVPSSRGRRSWWRPALAAAAVVMLCFALLLHWDNPVARAPVAVLEAAEKPVEVVRQGKGSTTTDQTLALEVGTTLRTDSENRSVVVFSGEENQLRLDEQTELKVSKLAKPRGDAELVEGEFELSKGRVWVTERSARVVVRTPDAILLPVGTEYEALTTENGTELVVWEGEVIARSLDGGHSVRVKQGEEIELGRKGWRQARSAPIREKRMKSKWHAWNRQIRMQKAQRRARRELRPAPRVEQLRNLPGLRRGGVEVQRKGPAVPRVEKPRAERSDSGPHRPAVVERRQRRLERWRERREARVRPESRPPSVRHEARTGDGRPQVEPGQPRRRRAYPVNPPDPERARQKIRDRVERRNARERWRRPQVEQLPNSSAGPAQQDRRTARPQVQKRRAQIRNQRSQNSGWRNRTQSPTSPVTSPRNPVPNRFQNSSRALPNQNSSRGSWNRASGGSPATTTRHSQSRAGSR